MDNADLIKAVVATFLGDMPRQLASLRQLVDDGQLQAAGRQAHQIKGAAANVSGHRLQQLALHVEEAARAGDAITVTNGPRLLDAAFAELREALRDYVA
jgi:HPt (histidine-containing phosphotransfer) domain-containing protein